MIILPKIPHGYDEILERYGDPDKDKNGDMDPDWYRNNTAVYDLPFPMRLSWDPNTTFLAC